VRAAALALGIALSGCGGAGTVAAETARATACQGVEETIERRMNAGEMTREDAIEAIDCTRFACDAIRAEIVKDEVSE
jgi:hypothetical protein